MKSLHNKFCLNMYNNIISKNVVLNSLIFFFMPVSTKCNGNTPLNKQLIGLKIVQDISFLKFSLIEIKSDVSG